MRLIASPAAIPYKIRFEIPGLPKLQTGQGSWRGAHAERKRWKKRVFSMVFGNTPPEPLRQARAEFTRYSASEPDFDNLVISFKAIRDGLTEAGVILDDNPDVLPYPVYLWEKAPRGEGRIEVRVEEIISPPLRA